jgi:predicted HD superfamily hydrolase involved in NAD metabolism
MPDAATLLHHLTTGVPLTSEVSHDIPAFLQAHGCPRTAVHCAAVAGEAARIAALVGADPASATLAGWLHDVSAVFPTSERLAAARAFALPVPAEEAAHPLLIHQRLSVVLAHAVFGVTGAAVLDAVGCHTTLRASATILDKLLFIADKLAWDDPDTPPYYDELRAALDDSLDTAVRWYLRYLWARRDTLPVIHPWLRAAYQCYGATADG